jgi:hypothetical protein
MSVNYVSDSSGKKIAVQIPITDWQEIKNRYPDIDNIESELPQWQKNIIDKRLKEIENNPASVQDIEGLFEELDKEIES